MNDNQPRDRTPRRIPIVGEVGDGGLVRLYDAARPSPAGRSELPRRSARPRLRLVVDADADR